MQLRIKTFEELTNRQLYEIVRVRTEIFLLEQNIVCQDFDGVDYDSLHCFLEEDGQVYAYLRAYRADNGEIKLGRVLTRTHGEGLGRTLMEGAMPAVCRQFQTQTITLHAQTHAQGFYEKMGFVACSNVFLEEGIPHVEMRWTAKQA